MKPINILVKSGATCRQFTTKTFSIKNLITQIRRYNPHATVECLWYGDFHPDFTSNEEWRNMPDMWDIPNSLGIPDKDKEYYLVNYNYRTAVNLFYSNCLNNGEYPRLHPFKNVTRSGEMPVELADFADAHYPMFLVDKDNPYTNKEDILKFLDGYRLEKKYNGYDIQGYVIENNRFSNQTDAE